MIKQKKKICRICKQECLIFSRGRCHQCALKEDSKPIRASKKIKAVSDKQKERLAKYEQIKNQYIELHPYCEYEGCTKPGEEIHHPSGRLGNRLFWPLMHICREHHLLIHREPAKAKEQGYLI